MKSLVPKIKDSMLAFEKTLEEGGDINAYISEVINHALDDGSIKIMDVAVCVCDIISFFDDDPNCYIWDEIDDSTLQIIRSSGYSSSIEVKTNKTRISNTKLTIWPRITLYGDKLKEISLPNAKGYTRITTLSYGQHTSLEKVDIRSWDSKDFPLDTHILNTVETIMNDYPALKELIVKQPVSEKECFRLEREKDIANFSSAQDSVKAKKLLNKELAFLDKVLKKG